MGRTKTPALLLRRERLVLGTLLLAYPDAVPTDKLVALLYPDDDGGPLTAGLCLIGAVKLLRAELKPFQIDVVNDGSCYRLAKFDDPPRLHLGKKERLIYNTIKENPGITTDRLVVITGLPNKNWLSSQLGKINRKMQALGQEDLVSTPNGQSRKLHIQQKTVT